MKKFFLFIYLLSAVVTQAQEAYKKLPAVGLHFFYNDFATAQLIKQNGLGQVLRNNQWNNPRKMQGGFGIDYTQGLTGKIDVTGNVNMSWTDYLLRSGTAYGSSHFLLDMNAGFHLKLLKEKALFNPLLIAKSGFTAYKNISGFSLLPGFGLQVNILNEAFILTTAEYRAALSRSLSNQFYYSIGIAVPVGKKKERLSKPLAEATPAPVEKPAAPIAKVPDTLTQPVQLITKAIAVLIRDEATDLPLPYAEITLKNTDRFFTAVSDTNGKVIFGKIPAGDYTIIGKLNGILSTEVVISSTDFDIAEPQLQVAVTHNDPRFTLVGHTVEASTGRPIGNTEVMVGNSTRSSTSFVTSDAVAGAFRSQLDAGSDFIISARKADFISNIEKISTRGLNRSTTLYVQLQLGIEEATAGKTIALNKIYFETGKAKLNTASSEDLHKLVLFLKDNPLVKLQIQGHTDNAGSRSANIILSRLRAGSVAAYLVQNGIAKERLLVKGYGPDVPVESNVTDAGKAKNRRVEIKIL